MDNINVNKFAKNRAIEKIDRELKEFKSGGTKESVIKDYVAETLKYFIDREIEFAEAIDQCDKTLSDCCEEIVKDIGSAISDIEVCKKAVSFYFPNADVSFHMSIALNPYEKKSEKKSIRDISLDDLFDI